MNKFKLGQIVILNSGSPEMTVTVIDGEYFVTATWFDGSDFQTYSFHVDTLKTP